MDSTPNIQPLYHSSKGTIHKTNVNVLRSPPTSNVENEGGETEVKGGGKENLVGGLFSVNSLGNHGGSRFYEYFPVLPSILSSFFNYPAKELGKGDEDNEVKEGGKQLDELSTRGISEKFKEIPIARAGDNNVKDQDSVFVITSYKS